MAGAPPQRMNVVSLMDPAFWTRFVRIARPSLLLLALMYCVCRACILASAGSFRFLSFVGTGQYLPGLFRFAVLGAIRSGATSNQMVRLLPGCSTYCHSSKVIPPTELLDVKGPPRLERHGRLLRHGASPFPLLSRLSLQLLTASDPQTELAHGSNVAGLETTATFDERTDEFVIHTPSVSATKWWIGGAFGFIR